MVAIFLFVLVIVALIVLAVTLVLNSSASKKAGAENQRTYSMEELYTNIVKAVAVENYEEAYELWHQYESDNRYSLTYKDLSDYYHYAAGLKGYVGAQEVCLNEVKTALEQVSKGFKRASFYLDEVNLLCESVHGAFVKPAPASSVYRMDIKRDGTADLQFDQPKSYTNVSYIKGEKVIWTLEDGKIVSGKVSGGPYFLSITPTEEGMDVQDRRQFGNDLELCGTYYPYDESEAALLEEESDEQFRPLEERTLRAESRE